MPPSALLLRLTAVLALAGAFRSPCRSPRPACALLARKDFSIPGSTPAVGPGEFYAVTLSRATGIDWASDLSFRWVYAREVEFGSSASLAGVQPGHQLVEVRLPDAEASAEALCGPGASFTQAMGALSSLPAGANEVSLTFYSGDKKSLRAALAKAGGTGEDAGVSGEDQDTITVKVSQADQSLSTITAPAGSNLRNVLIAEGINVYRSVTRWSNCNGKQLCGTCIVDVAKGGENCSAKSIDEASTLRENPETYRLSCVTFVYGDVEVEVLPPKVTAAQWTR